MAYSRFSETFDGRTPPGMSPAGTSAAWGPSGEFSGRHRYNPHQPRVPAGRPDGGQWTRMADGWMRLASNDGSADKPHTKSDAPPIGAQEPPTLPDRPPNSAPGQAPRRPGVPAVRPPRPRMWGPRGKGWVGVVAEVLRHVIEYYRKKTSDPDLFGNDEDRDDTVLAATDLDGRAIIGMNSRHPDYTDADDLAAARLRAELLNRFPWMMSRSNIGGVPNNALFHAETTVLLRAARSNGGSLADKILIVRVDHEMCHPSCPRLLPYVGLALGNPTVTFIDNVGTRRTMRDGKWID